MRLNILSKAIALFVVITAGIELCVAQTPATGAVRKVLFTLGEAEDIYQGEFYAQLYPSGTGFALVTVSRRDSIYSFVFNGRRIISSVAPISVGHIDPSKENGYSFTYRGADGFYANIKGQVDGPFEMVKSYPLSYLYSLAGQRYINVDGTVMGPYKDVYGVKVTEGGKYAFGFKKDGKDYANVNGSILGPNNDPYDVTINESGKYLVKYQQNGQWFTEGDPSEVYKEPAKFAYSWDEIEIHSSNNKHSLYSNFTYPFVVVNGRRTGRAAALKAWYDEKRNAFFWSAVEGREIAFYEYDLNKASSAPAAPAAQSAPPKSGAATQAGSNSTPTAR
jgi:hypothetical protein